MDEYTVRRLARTAGVSVRTLHLQELLRTLDRTIAHYQGGSMLSEAEMYQGFSPEKIDRIKKEARERYGTETVEASERKVRGMSKEAFAAVGREGEAVNADLARLLGQGKDPGDASVQAVVARHYAWILHFWRPTAESYRGLGRGYVEQDEFRAYYEKYAPGLADFLRRAIEEYCERFPEPERA